MHDPIPRVLRKATFGVWSGSQHCAGLGPVDWTCGLDRVPALNGPALSSGPTWFEPLLSLTPFPRLVSVTLWKAVWLYICITVWLYICIKPCHSTMYGYCVTSTPSDLLLVPIFRSIPYPLPDCRCWAQGVGITRSTIEYPSYGLC